MRAAVLPARDLPAGFVPAWRALERTALEPNPFFAPEMVQPAVRHLAGRADVQLLCAFDGPDLAFLAPVTVSTAPLGLPVPAMVGWRHRHCFLGTPLVSSAAAVEAWRAVLRLRQEQRRPAWTVLPGARLDGPVAQALGHAARDEGVRFRTAPRGLRPCFERPADGRTPLERSSKATIKRMLQYHRHLVRAVGSDCVTVDRGSDPHVERHVERFLALEASGWKGRAGTAVACRAADARFFREACRAFAGQGRLRVFDLGGPSRSAAMMVSLVAGDGLFDFKIAYDEALADGRPGTLLVAETARCFLADPRLQWWDSCADPDNEWAGRLMPDRRLIGRLLVAGRGVQGPLAVSAAPWWTAFTRQAWRRWQQLPAPLGHPSAAGGPRPV